MNRSFVKMALTLSILGSQAVHAQAPNKKVAVAKKAVIHIAQNESETTSGISKTQFPAAKSEVKPKFKGTWTALISGDRNLSAEGTSDAVATTGLGLKLGYHFNDEFKMSFGVKASLVAGHKLVNDEKAAKPSESKIGVSDASATYTTSDVASARFGAVPQFGAIHSPLVIGKFTFPALRLTAADSIKSVGKDEQGIGFILQGAIPTTYSMSTLASENEKTPSLVSARLGGKVSGDVGELGLKLGAYQFNDLPQAITKETSNSTKTIAGAKPGESVNVLQYQIRGYEAQLDATLNVTKHFKVYTGGAFIRNSEAPTDLNSGWLATAGMNFDLSEKFTLNPEFNQYRVEPDAAVSSYNYVGTNKSGYSAEVKLIMNKKLKFFVSGDEATLIYDKPDQYYTRSYSIGILAEDIPF